MGDIRSEIKEQFVSGFFLNLSGYPRHIKMEDENVYYNIVIKKSASEVLEGFVNEIGGQISIEKQIKFEDLGLAEVEGQPDYFHCLVCSKILKRKWDAIKHFKNTHINQTELNISCPRCDAEVTKSNLNSHMAQVHGLKKFNQLMKRSFLPQSDCQPSSSKNVDRIVRKRKADTLDLSIKIEKIEKDIRQKKNRTNERRIRRNRGST